MSAKRRKCNCELWVQSDVFHSRDSCLFTGVLMRAVDCHERHVLVLGVWDRIRAGIRMEQGAEAFLLPLSGQESC